MINSSKFRLVKIGILAFLAIVFFSLGLGFGSKGKVPTSQVDTMVKDKIAEKQKTDKKLTQTDVEKFLISYYTKKNLEENRNRYKPFMTKALYQSVVANEELAINQAYKGYVVNQIFQDADIYINSKRDIVIAKSTFSNITLNKKSDDISKGSKQNNEETLKLTYTKENDKYVVSNISFVEINENPEGEKNGDN